MAIPHVVALYQWLRDKPDVSFPMLNDYFAQEELDEVVAQSKLNNDIFAIVARLKALGQKPNIKDLKSAWFANSEDYDGLADFVGFIRDQNEQAHHNPLQVTLSYLLQHPETAANDLNTFKLLFVSWIVSTTREACAWYEDDDTQEKLSNHQEIHLALGRLVTDHYQQEARALFKLVTNPLGLIPLFAEHYDNPQRMAAFILCLLEQGATSAKRNEIAGKIIQSGLLHEFFLNNAGFMGDANNPVKQLYGLLGTFDVANALAKQVSLISVMTKAEQREAEAAERAGRVSNKRYFEHYSLDGTEPTAELNIVDIRPIVFDSVPQAEAFKSFYRLFGQRFLLNMLSYYGNSRNVGVKKILEQQFNNLSSEGVSQQELVQLLNVLARENKEPLLRAIAELLQEPTINALIESGNFAVFHLIIFKAGLLEKLNLAQVQRYIASLQPGDNSFDHLILLRKMLLQLKSRRGAEDVTALLFDKILNVLMNDPNLDDGSLIQALQSVAGTPNCKALLQQHAVLLLEQLNQLIQGVITEDQGLTPDTSQDLNDAWRDLARKLSVLKEISPDLVSDFPHDKYAFYVSVVKAVLAHQGDHFDLQATLSNFFPAIEEQELLLHYPEGSVSEHERTLIELLVTIENEALWVQAIQQLEAQPINRMNWVEQQYNGQALVELASKQGNNSLIQYLLKENKLNQAGVNHLLRTAIAAKRWDTVKHLIYLPGADKPDLESVSEALVAATKANQLAWLLTPEPSALQGQGLFQEKRRKIELPVDPAQLLTLLAAHGEEDTIKQLIQLSPPEFLQFLATRTNVTDYSGRTFTNISAFQLMSWALDSQMIVDAMLKPLQKAFNEGYTEAETIRQELKRQYQEIQTTGVSYTLNGEAKRGEHHFNFQPLIAGLDTYVEQYDSRTVPQCQEHWCHIVGMLQRLVPAHVAQHYCEKKPFDGKKPFRNTTLLRALRFCNYTSTAADNVESWFPLTRDNRLGFDFAIYNWWRATEGRVGGLRGARENSAALSALLKARTEDFAELRELLAMPLQKWDLDMSYGMTL